MASAEVLANKLETPRSLHCAFQDRQRIAVQLRCGLHIQFHRRAGRAFGILRGELALGRLHFRASAQNFFDLGRSASGVKENCRQRDRMVGRS